MSSRASHFFDLGILVGLFNNSSDVSEEYGSPRTCLSTLSRLREGDLNDQSPLKMSWVLR